MSDRQYVRKRPGLAWQRDIGPLWKITNDVYGGVPRWVCGGLDLLAKITRCNWFFWRSEDGRRQIWFGRPG